MLNGGLSGGMAVGHPCGEKVECEDGAFCESGCCVQFCKGVDRKLASQATASRGIKNALCRCRLHKDCHSFNCKYGFCQMKERMNHSPAKERDLRAWHATLAHEEALDELAMNCSSGSCTMSNIDLAVVLAFPIQGSLPRGAR